ncbi:MAG: hypothetical protein C5B49_10875, partial [Bdellovibrio sp.]
MGGEAATGTRGADPMDEQVNSQIKIGVFLALGLMAVLGSILALGGDRALFRDFVRLTAKLPQVQGLNKGSIISLAGVTVGN